MDAVIALPSSLQYFASRHPFFIAFLLLVALRLLNNKYGSRLNGIPGPAIASYTRLWRVFRIWKGDAHLVSLDLHRKHGNLVRIGPYHVSVADPSLIPVFYSTSQNYLKTGFYPPISISWKKQVEWNLFSVVDVDFHRTAKRKVGHAYSLQSLLQSEEAIDSCDVLFMKQLAKFADGVQPVDLGIWLQYYAFDVMGELSFARKFGFLEEGRDIDNIISDIEGMLTYFIMVGQVPELHNLLLGNPILTKVMPAMEDWDKSLLFTLKAINTRASIKRDGELINADVEGRDMLAKWAYVKSSDPLKMSTKDIVVALAANVLAGSDTTAIALRAIVYYLCRNPHCMKKMQDEIDGADDRGELSHPIAFKEASILPYVNAVIKEGTRMHPSIGLILERFVPAGGVTIDGHHLPAGTIVGINPWIACRNETIFPDPDTFRPERWLEATGDHLRKMDNAWELTFGAGARKCTGRHIAWIEMMKVIPELIRTYDITLASPDREWQVQNHWFTQQKGLICNLAKRGESK